MSEGRRGAQRGVRALTLVVILLLVPALYRTLVVYEWRPGHCAASPEPPVVISGDTSRAGGEGGTLRVISWNIGGHATLFSRDHVRRASEVLVALDGDVIALQEVHRGTWQARFGDQVRELAARTGMTAVYAPSFRTPEGDYGNLILTRGSVMSASRLDLPGLGEPRAVLTARLGIRGETVTVSSTHLSAWGPLNRRWRKIQAGCIADTFGRQPGIVAGDLNTGPDSEELQSLFAAGWRESDADSIPTHDVMGTKLDYVLIPAGFDVLGVAAPDGEVSDHRPLVVDLIRRSSNHG